MEPNHRQPIVFWDILIIILSSYVLLALIVSSFLSLNAEIAHLLDYIDNGICVFFLIDLIIRYRQAENKRQFWKWGWIDLIASIPTVDAFRYGRAMRLFRLLRVLRAVRSTRQLFYHLYRNRAQSTFSTVGLIAILSVVFSSIAILMVETDPTSNIKTAEDALWWSYVTVTTVGYGDKYPVTTEGRLIAAILMTVGVGLFGTLTALLSSWMLGADHSA